MGDESPSARYTGEHRKQDWSKNWDASPTLQAAPRWTIDEKSGRGVVLEDKYQDRLVQRKGGHSYVLPLKKVPTGHRDTWLDAHQRTYAWVPGPGTFKTSRDFQHHESVVEKHLSEKRGIKAENDEFDSKKTVHSKHEVQPFKKGAREASCTNVRQVRRMLLPTNMFSVARSADALATYEESSSKGQLCPLRKVDPHKTRNDALVTPGPGHYVQFTSFGAASGPTRSRYFATNGGDMGPIKPRTPAKFTRSYRRAAGGDGASSLMGSRSFSSPGAL